MKIKKRKLPKIMVSFFLWFLGVIYLFLPPPPLPDFISAARSNEPGDSYQHPNQKAFFTDYIRTDTLNHFQKQFQIKLGSINIPNFRLNYPPEETLILVRDQIPSNYLEEIVNPLRESLFVSGWEPEKAPAYQHLSLEKRPKIIIDGQYYFAKVTVKWQFSPLWTRLLVWTLIFPASYLVYLSLRYSFKIKIAK